MLDSSCIIITPSRIFFVVICILLKYSLCSSISLQLYYWKISWWYICLLANTVSPDKICICIEFELTKGWTNEGNHKYTKMNEFWNIFKIIITIGMYKGTLLGKIKIKFENKNFQSPMSLHKYAYSVEIPKQN